MLLEGYYNARWISDTDEMYAISEYMFSLGGGIFSWKFYKHTILRRSTMEVELTTIDTTYVRLNDFMNFLWIYR